MKKKYSPKVVKRFVYAVAIFSVLLLAFAGIGGGWVYYVYAKNLPSDETLLNWQTKEATRIFDRNGMLLYEVFGEQKRVVVGSDQISQHVKNATIAIEDERFYEHPGVDVHGILRAVVNNAKADSSVEGASTITQQLVKNAYLSSDRTFDRKIKEALLAVRFERHYTKEQILTDYLNQVGYGGNNYGIEAAANSYFGKSAKDVTVSQAATLAALVKSPSYLSPYGENTDQLITRRNTVLDKMVQLSFITAEEAEKAKSEKLAVNAREEKLLAPHFVMYVKQLLVEKYGQEVVENGGLQVTTSIDYNIQDWAEDLVGGYIPHIGKSGANNAGLVVIDPKTGGILSMVGSRDYFDEAHDGNVNVTLSTRPPGSSFKPVVYAQGFEKGWSPGSTLFDVETDFGSKQDPYKPQNYNKKFRGPVSIREALANSYNIPAVKMMAILGKEETLEIAKKVGITTLTDANNYGLSLVLGGGDVRLLELSGAYGAFANNGILNLPTAITKVVQHDKVLFEAEHSPKPVFRSEVAAEINSILSDNKARVRTFGPSGPLVVKGHDVAVKTGTTNDYRDAWTIGYTPSVVVGVWVGNNDFSPMKEGSAGAMAAAPIWNAFMTRYLDGKANEPFSAPNTLESATFDVVTGKSPTGATRETRQDVVASWQKPGTVQLAAYKIFDCDGNEKEQKQFYVVHSEKPDNQNWEKPVTAWARAHGYPTSQQSDVHEECQKEELPVQTVSNPDPEPLHVGGAPEPLIIEVTQTNPRPIEIAPMPTPASTVVLTPTPMPSPTIAPEPNPDSSPDPSENRRRRRDLED